MGKKSKGRVPIKGGSKKVRKIKNVQEGGRSIGSDKDMDIKMTKLLHFFKFRFSIISIILSIDILFLI